MPKTPDYFQGKTIVITGAASGIGRAAALVFAREGANVVCTDVNDKGVEQTAEMIDQQNAKMAKTTNAGGKPLALTIDVTKRAAIDDMIELSLNAFGRIHFLFNSAGSALKRSKFLDIDDDLIERTFDLNFKGTFWAMQAVLPHMLENKFGVIVNVASMAVKRGGPSTSVHYAAAKGAVNTMTMGVAREFANQGIRCLSISPGPIDTAFAAAAATSPELKAKMLADIPMARFGKAEEIAELVLFMCSDACEFMTADTVYANGGGGWR